MNPTTKEIIDLAEQIGKEDQALQYLRDQRREAHEYIDNKYNLIEKEAKDKVNEYVNRQEKLIVKNIKEDQHWYKNDTLLLEVTKIIAKEEATPQPGNEPVTKAILEQFNHPLLYGFECALIGHNEGEPLLLPVPVINLSGKLREEEINSLSDTLSPYLESLRTSSYMDANKSPVITIDNPDGYDEWLEDDPREPLSGANIIYCSPGHYRIDLQEKDGSWYQPMPLENSLLLVHKLMRNN